MALLIVMPVFIQKVQAQRSLTKEDSAWFNDNIEFIQQAPAILSSSIQQKNWKELARGMVSISENKYLYKKLQEYSDDLSDFNDKNMVNSHLDLYREL